MLIRILNILFLLKKMYQKCIQKINFFEINGMDFEKLIITWVLFEL